MVGYQWTLVAITTWITLVQGHVRLDFPLARDLPLDFLDNVRTPAPCGMPKGEAKTTFKAGSTFNATWHLGYPHQGRFCVTTSCRSITDGFSWNFQADTSWNCGTQMGNWFRAWHLKMVDPRVTDGWMRTQPPKDIWWHCQLAWSARIAL